MHHSKMSDWRRSKYHPLVEWICKHFRISHLRTMQLECRVYLYMLLTIDFIGFYWQKTQSTQFSLWLPQWSKMSAKSKMLTCSISGITILAILMIQRKDAHKKLLGINNGLQFYYWHIHLELKHFGKNVSNTLNK
jgi:hypothetical protein